MILKSFSKKIKEYGFPVMMEYNNPDFYSNQKSVCIAIKSINGDIIRNYMPVQDGLTLKDLDDRLEEMLKDKDILILERMTYDDELKEPIIQLFIPYYVEEHSSFNEYLPRFNNKESEEVKDIVADVVTEILFSINSYSRYSLLRFKSTKESPYFLVNDLFSKTPEELDKHGLKLKSIHYNGSFDLSFYDIPGEEVVFNFSNAEKLKDFILSVRVIEYNEINPSTDKE